MLLKLSAAGALAATLLMASGAAQATELLTNGGFEGGATTSTIGGHTNTSVPTGWTPNAAFDLEPGFNHLTSDAHSGDNALSISNFDVEPVAMLAQSFGDVAGQIYTVSFWAFDGGAGGDGNAFLTVSAGAGSQTFLDNVSTYTQGGFTFIGTGSDTLTISAQTNPSEWFVDDVSVSGASVGPGVPEPATWAMMILGLGGAGAMLRRRRSQPGLA